MGENEQKVPVVVQEKKNIYTLPAHIETTAAPPPPVSCFIYPVVYLEGVNVLCCLKAGGERKTNTRHEFLSAVHDCTDYLQRLGSRLVHCVLVKKFCRLLFRIIGGGTNKKHRSHTVRENNNKTIPLLGKNNSPPSPAHISCFMRIYQELVPLRGRKVIRTHHIKQYYKCYSSSIWDMNNQTKITHSSALGTIQLLLFIDTDI